MSISEVKQDVNTVANALNAENMLYGVPKLMSMAEERTQGNESVDKNGSYTQSETIKLTFSTGNTMVDPKKTVVSFDVITDSVTADFGKGSGFNLMAYVAYYDPNGKLISNPQQFNLKKRFEHRFTRSLDWWASKGYAMGYPPTSSLGTGALGAASSGDGDSDFTTPGFKVSFLLSEIPCFNLYGDVLIPPYLINGGRLEIYLESAATALLTTGLTGVSYSVSNVRCRTDMTRLKSQYIRAIDKMAENGLNLMFKDYFVSNSDYTTSLQFSHVIQQVCSRALKCYAIPRLSSSLLTDQKDSMIAETKSSAVQFQQYQVDLGGSRTIPSNPIVLDTGDASNNIKRIGESYGYVVSALSSNEKHYNCVSNPEDYVDIDGIMAVDLTLNHLSDIQGVRLHKNYLVKWNHTFNSADERQITYYLEFLRMLVVLPDNTVRND